MTRLLAATFLCVAAAARAQIGVPRAGCVHEGSGALRPLYGTAGAFVPGETIQSGVLSAACSGQLTLLKTEDALEVRDAGLRLLARWPAPGGPARFAFTGNGTAALVYFAASGELMSVDAKRAPRRVPGGESMAGGPLAIASPDPQHLSALLPAEGGARLIRIALRNGTVERDSGLEGVTGLVLLLRDGTLVHTAASEVVLLRPGGKELRFALPGRATALYGMGDHLAGITFANGAAALRIEEGREQLFRVPEAAR